MWIHSVPKEIADSVSDTEKKRQEAINEVIYTERDFVRDMEYLRDVRPLKYFHRAIFTSVYLGLDSTVEEVGYYSREPPARFS